MATASSSLTFSTSLPKFCRPYSISRTPPPQVSVYFKKLSISSSVKISRRTTTRASSMASSGITTIDQNNKKVVEVFDTEEDLAVSLAKYTADLSDKFAKERGAFTVVVSGGSLIKSLRYLSL
jgi:6-phosphogluconolactonase